MSSPESTQVVQNPALMRFSIWMGNTSLCKDRGVIVLRDSFGSLQLEASSNIWECCLSRNPLGGYEDLYALWGPDWKMFQQAARELELVDDKKEFFDALEEAACFMKADRLRQFLLFYWWQDLQCWKCERNIKLNLCKHFFEIFVKMRKEHIS